MKNIFYGGRATGAAWRSYHVAMMSTGINRESIMKTKP